MKFDWQQVFLSDLSMQLALEIILKTILMFTIVLVFLRLSGKKGIQQLSIFEVAIIISLGSAAGDPMLSEDFAIIPSLLVFAAVLGVYRLLTYLATKSEGIENIMEGKPIYIIEEGVFTLDKGDNTIAKDEFLAEMRVKGIEHLGQVRTAILETNGQVSFFYFEDEDVVPGLPILPKVYARKSMNITETADYACTFCGTVSTRSEGGNCRRCNRNEWVKSIDKKRIV